MTDKKGIIFDMDGTVWDSSENVAKSWTVKVHEAGFTDKTVTREDIQSVMGKPMDVIAKELLPDTDQKVRDAVMEKCMIYEEQTLEENAEDISYRGVRDTIRELSKKLPSMSEDEQYALLATDGMLVKRPLVVGKDCVLTGFKEEEWKEKLL